MRTTLIVVGVTAFYFLFLAGLVRWAQSRLLKRARAAVPVLEAVGARVLGTHPSKGFRQPATVEFEIGAQRARYEVKQYSRDFIVQTIRLASPPMPGILVRAERALDRLGKSMGLDREVQLGDAAFDAAAYIDSAASEALVRRAFERVDVRARTLDLLRLGYALNLSAEGVGASRIRGYYAAFEAPELPEVLRVLGAIQGALPRFDPSEATQAPRRVTWAAVGGAIAAGLALASFAIIPLAHPPMDDMDSLRAIGLGLFAWLAALAAAWVALRGRPNGVQALLTLSILLFFTVPLLAAAGLFAINSGMDRAPATVHTVELTAMATRDRDLYFASWRPGRARDRVSVSREVFRTLHPGDSIAIETHPGALGWTWVASVRRVAR